MKSHILVIDDDPRLIDLLSRYLEQEGFLTSLAESASSARRLLRLFMYDLIILDYMMPHEDGMTFLQNLRNKQNETPVLMLTAKNEAQDRILAFESGADDYLGKNFNPKELILRINNILRRQSPQQDFYFGDLRLCHRGHEVWCGKKRVPLSASQKSLLLCLAEARGRIVPRDLLLQKLQSDSHPRSVDTQITRLRARLMQWDAIHPSPISAIRGKGYKLNLNSSS